MTETECSGQTLAQAGMMCDRMLGMSASRSCMRSNSLPIMVKPREIINGVITTASMMFITGGGRMLKRMNNSNEMYRTAPTIVMLKPRLDVRLSPVNDTSVPESQMPNRTRTPKYTRTNAIAPASAKGLIFGVDILVSLSLAEYQLCSFKDYVERNKKVSNIQHQGHQNAPLLENLGFPDLIREKQPSDIRYYVSATEQEESESDRPESSLEDCYV